MAYKIVLTHNFEAKASETSKWVEKIWSFQSALKFQKKLLKVIESSAETQKLGSHL